MSLLSLPYPHAMAHDEACSAIDTVLGRSPNANVLCDERFGLSHCIWRWCLEYDLNPAWPLISLQRERSLLGKPADSLADWLYAFGYVGQDGPGTVNKRWNGLEMQAWLCIRQSAWICGFGPPDAYGVYRGLRPGAARWNPDDPSAIQLYGDAAVKADKYVPKSMNEHLILTYTPHLEAIERAEQILHQFAPEFQQD